MRKLSKKEWVAVAVAIAFVGYIFFGNVAFGVLSKFRTDDTSSYQNTNMQNNVLGDSTPDFGGVAIEDVIVGSGEGIRSGQQVAVHYVLSLVDGTVLQDSKVVGGGQPFIFTYGAGQLIPGWEIGIQGMKVGGKRIINIPPELGYGAQAVGPIPANSVLVFEIEVVAAQ